VIAIAAVPLFSVLVPPMGDYPNHLARLHILARIGQSPALQRLYEVHWQVAPYVGMDALGVALARLMPIYTVGRLLVLLVMALFLFGAVLLHRAFFGRISGWPLLAGLFLYSYPLHVGLVPYLLAAALAVIGYAVWVQAARWPAAVRIAATASAATAVYFCHYYGVVVLGICIAGHEVACWWAAGRSRHDLLHRIAQMGLAFLPPAALVMAVTGEAAGGATHYDPWLLHLQGMVSATLFPGSRFDMAILVFAIGAIAAGLATRRLEVARPVWLPVIVMMGLTLVLPGAPFGLWGMQFRFPVVAAVVLAAAIRPRAWGWPEQVAAGLAGLLFLGHVGTIAASWRSSDVQYRELRAALAAIPVGARLLPVRVIEGLDRKVPRGPLFGWVHMPALAVIERDAFLPNLHKQPMMTVQATPATIRISPREGLPPTGEMLWFGAQIRVAPWQLPVDERGQVAYWIDWPHQFDVAMALDFGSRAALPPALRLLHRGSFFSLYRVVPSD